MKTELPKLSMLKVILTLEERGEPISEILRRTNLNANCFYEIIEYLMRMGLVEDERVKRTRKVYLTSRGMEIKKMLLDVFSQLS